MSTVDQLLDRLRAGETLAEAGRALNLEPGGLILALGEAGLGLNGLGTPSLVQEAPRRPWLEPALSEEALAGLLPGAGRPERLALAAGLLQIHDFWDASHEAAQAADDLGERSSSAYWHGIAHRREPDPGNAGYWFRRVGRHPMFAPLGEAARPLLDEFGDPALTDRLIPRGSWDPIAFIDLCRSARPGSPAASLATACRISRCGSCSGTRRRRSCRARLDESRGRGEKADNFVGWVSVVLDAQPTAGMVGCASRTTLTHPTKLAARVRQGVKGAKAGG